MKRARSGDDRVRHHRSRAILRFIAAALCAGFLAGGLLAEALGQGKGGRGGAGSIAPTRSQEDFEQLGQITVGLVPVYPTAARCPEISSPFGSPTRYDGSPRANDHFGFHNGMDLTAAPGTPLLAVAAGDVVHAGQGGMLVGNFIWLRHRPEDTGLPVYLYSRYQHLDKPSPHAVGARLAVGDVVGPAGKTGTVGGYYGPNGYSHLHLLLHAIDGPDYSIREAIVDGPGRRILDPLALYLDPSAPFDNHALRDLPAARKRVTIPYQTTDGARQPAATRMIWPLACARP